MRPLGDPTLSFGGEWQFSLPQVDFRADFPALYAAVLETFCMNRWRHPAKPASQRKASRQDAPAAAKPISAAKAAAAGVPPSPARPIAAVIRSTPRERKIGAICALTGSVALAWIIVSHLPPSFEAKHASRGTAIAENSTVSAIVKTGEPPAHIAAAASTPAMPVPAEVKEMAAANAAPAETRVEQHVAASTNPSMATAANSQPTANDISHAQTQPVPRVAAASAPTAAVASNPAKALDMPRAATPAPRLAAAASAPASVSTNDKPAAKLALAPAPQLQASAHSDEHVPMPRHPAEPVMRPELVVRRPPLPETLPPGAHFYAGQQASTAGQTVADATPSQQDPQQPVAPAKPDAPSIAAAATQPAADPGRYAAQIPGYAKDTTWVSHMTHRRITDSPDQFGM
jgi:hypothetical protein